MNDDFLTRFQKPPRPEFAEELFRKINQPAPKAGLNLGARAALAASALCAALALTLLVSPAARAAVLALLQEIGGVVFVETSDYPGTGDETIIPEEIMSLEQARAVAPFPISLPTWVPEGLVREESVRITRFFDDYTPVSITWRGNTAYGNDIYLELMIAQNTRNWIVGEEGVETVKINGQDAALVRGMWNANTKQWDTESDAIGLSLYWAKGETAYCLSSPTLPLEVLIRIAESIP